MFGTSSCTMTTTREPVFVPGVWGPYYSAMLPGAWLNEGGQSVAGAAIERLLAMHPAAGEAQARADAQGVSLPGLLTSLAVQASADLTADYPGRTAARVRGVTVSSSSNRVPSTSQAMSAGRVTSAGVVRAVRLGRSPGRPSVA